ncbi:hypothetical protein E4U13_004336 [Claviceps humidiphila]|uniref:Uncharacterized protein n=1 Tax=Claviceps humidiphila TaxID=1294629 RepID=A0A9P7QAV0_9HYPO|nr:hypothetical protein E4U13_004336 [Claviceps humidiphila]
MRPNARLPLRLLSRTAALSQSQCRTMHITACKAATVAPTLGAGPPPEPPTPTVRNMTERIERRRRQADMMKQVKVIRNAQDGKTTTLRKRFWKEVTVSEVDGAFQICLDNRPLRHAQTKEIISLPISKPALAFAIALEWDSLTSTIQATKHHLIPLTGLVSRALDIQASDADNSPGAVKIRDQITTTVMRYLDTDSLLCWAAPAGDFDIRNDAGESLRDVQKRTAEEIVSFMTTHVWPGIKLAPVLDGHAILPKKQEDGVRDVVQGWVSRLTAWEMAGLERAVLAGKSLVAAARLLAEWTEGPARRPGGGGDESVFGVEKAAKMVNLEVDWQATQWGEVEDTHDVNNEDLRRQLGSVVLLVSGTGKEA